MLSSSISVRRSGSGSFFGRLALAFLVAAACAAQFDPAAHASTGPRASQPLEPQAALATFQVAPDVRLELAAAEPEVIDPVAIRFDEDGRMWVVEMR
ncbi:MAG: hypothetical protein ACC645_05000, partial [Pirellulales bacterium]